MDIDNLFSLVELITVFPMDLFLNYQSSIQNMCGSCEQNNIEEINWHKIPACRYFCSDLHLPIVLYTAWLYGLS